MSVLITHDRASLKAMLGKCTVSWLSTEKVCIQCDPSKLKEAVEYLELKGYVRIEWRHPMKRTKMAVDLTVMIIEGEKDLGCGTGLAG